MFPFAVLLVLVAIPSAGFGDEVDLRLAQLGAPSVHVRQRAERWLTAHVDVSHVPRLAPLIRNGDAEIRRRIARIVAQADADLTMTARLMDSGDDLVASVGEQALTERINRWNPLLANPGETELALGEILGRLAGEHGPRALRVELDTPLGEVCALLERRAGLLLGITVEAEVAARERRRPDEAVVVAGWNQILTRVASAYGVGLDLFGFDRTDDGTGVRGFVRFTPTMAGRGRERTGEEVLVRWFRQSTNDAQPAQRIAAARNLAASGWPDALAWMEARYRADGDAAALQALLLAAGAGRVAPVLYDGDVLRTLVRDASTDLASGEAGRRSRAYRVLDALGRLGCLDGEGRDLTPALLDGFDAAGDPGRWLRLAILEDLGCPSARETASAVALDPRAVPGLRVQALRAWVAATVGRPEPGTADALPGAEALVGSVTSVAAAADLARLLAQSGLVPTWTEPTSLPADWGFEPRLAVFGWAALAGLAPERVAALALDVLTRAPGGTLARGEAVAAALRALAERGGPAPLAAVWDAAREAAPQDVRLEVERVALLAELVSPEDGLEVFQALRDRPLGSGPDLALLALAAGWGDRPEGGFARQRLTVLLQEALSGDASPEAAAGLVAAFEAALAALQQRGMDGAARDWRQPTILGLLRRYRSSRLAAALRANWPPYPVPAPIDPAARDRRGAPR